MFAADSDSKKTPQQKLEIWLKAPARQKWHSKKLIGESWWRLLDSLPLEQAEKMWPAAVKTQKASRMADVAHLLVQKKENYQSAKAYYQDKLKTPKEIEDFKDSKGAKVWKRARGHKYQLTRVLIYFAKKGNLKQETINKEALEITGGKIQRAKWGIDLLGIVTGKAKGTLLLNAIHKYGSSPRQMKLQGGLLKQLQTALDNKIVSHDDALKVVKRAKSRTNKKIAKMKKDNKHYNDYKQLASKLDDFYNKLKG